MWAAREMAQLLESRCTEEAMTDLSDMELFVHATALGSLTKAAVKLNLTQSAASRRIASLEERFGGRLFHRTGRGVHLTELGASVLPRVKALVSEAEQLVVDARGLSGRPVGRVVLGVLPSVSRPFVGELFREVQQRWPEIRLQINEAFGGLLDEDVANGTVDLAVLNRYGAAPPDTEELLARVEMLLIGPPGDQVTRKSTIVFKELAGLPMLLPSAPNTWQSVLEKAARRLHVKLDEAMAVDSVSLLRDVVMGGGCYAIVPSYSVERDVAAGRLQASRIVRPTMSRMITLSITSQHPMTLATREVARLVRRLVPGVVARSGLPAKAISSAT